MKLSRFLLSLAIATASTGLLHADFVTLKDGTKLEGTILEQTDAGVKIKYKVTAKIYDEKFVPAADIASVLKEKPEEVEIKDLRKLMPTADLLTAEKYEQIIQDRLRPFVNRYPGTPQAAEIQKMIDELQEEKEKVVAGGIKMDSKWLSSQDARAEKYNIDAYAIRNKMNELAAANDFAGAMREFEQFNARGSNHKISIHYPKAVEEAIAILTNYEARLSQMDRDQPTLQKSRDDNMKRLIEPDLSRAKNAIEKEVTDAKNKYDAEKKEYRWAAPYKYDSKQIKEQSRLVTTEKTKLGKINVDQYTKAAEVLHQATLCYYNDKLQEGYGLIVQLQQLGAGIPEFGTVAQSYGQAFQKKNYENLAKQQTPQGTNLAPGAAAGTPGAAPGADAAMAQALAMAQQQQQQPGVAPAAGYPQQPGVAPAAGYPQQPGVAPAAGYPQQPGVAPVGYPQVQQPQQPGMPATGAYPQPGVPPVVAPVPGTPAPAVAPVATPSATTVDPLVEESAFDLNTILMIAGGVVVLVLLIAVASGKKKK